MRNSFFQNWVLSWGWVVRSVGSLLAFALCVIFAVPSSGKAQTDIHISGPQSGFPVAVARLCNAGVDTQTHFEVPDVITRDLDISGFFKVLSSSTHIESAERCLSAQEIAYSDWSVIGAEGLIRGVVRPSGGKIEAELFLHDVLKQRVVVGKRYVFEPEDYRRVAHRFANEVVKFFTGRPGVFGSKIAYVSKVGRFKELFVMDLDGANTRQLTFDKGLIVSPSWSPQADEIVYTSYKTRKPELYVINSQGTGLRRVTERHGLEMGAHFSPDGRDIVASATVDGVSNIVTFTPRGRLSRKLTYGSAIDVSPLGLPMALK